MIKFFALFLLFTTALCAEHFTLQNDTPFHKIAIQWASSARMAQESNDSLMQEETIPPKDLHYLRKNTTRVSIPKNAAYFRILVWESEKNPPEFLTNWVEVVPGKKYFLKEEHLTPYLLMNGMGC